MNPDSDIPQPSPRDLLEERVTALIVGELSETDAAEIRGIMASNASLKAFYDQMVETIGLVSDTLTQPAESDDAEIPAEPKLSDERREALKVAFDREPEEPLPAARKPSPKAEAKIRRPWFSYRLVQIACALAFLGLLTAVITPNFVKARRTAQVSSELAPISTEGDRYSISGQVPDPTSAFNVELPAGGMPESVSLASRGSVVTMNTTSGDRRYRADLMDLGVEVPDNDSAQVALNVRRPAKKLFLPGLAGSKSAGKDTTFHNIDRSTPTIAAKSSTDSEFDGYVDVNRNGQFQGQSGAEPGLVFAGKQVAQQSGGKSANTVVNFDAAIAPPARGFEGDFRKQGSAAAAAPNGLASAKPSTSWGAQPVPGPKLVRPAVAGTMIAPTEEEFTVQILDAGQTRSPSSVSLQLNSEPAPVMDMNGVDIFSFSAATDFAAAMAGREYTATFIDGEVKRIIAKPQPPMAPPVFSAGNFGRAPQEVDALHDREEKLVAELAKLPAQKRKRQAPLSLLRRSAVVANDEAMPTKTLEKALKEVTEKQSQLQGESGGGFGGGPMAASSVPVNNLFADPFPDARAKAREKTKAERSQDNDMDAFGSSVAAGGGAPPLLDAFGQPIGAAGAGRDLPYYAIDLENVVITIDPPMTDLTLRQALNVISQNADLPIQFVTQDFGITWAQAPMEIVSPQTRLFKVDPKKFMSGVDTFSEESQQLAPRKGPSDKAKAAARKQREELERKLDEIVLDELLFDDLPLGEVVRFLNEEVHNKDKTKKGINFVINPYVGPQFNERDETPAPNAPNADKINHYLKAAGVNVGTKEWQTKVFFNEKGGTLMARAVEQDMKNIEKAIFALTNEATTGRQLVDNRKAARAEAERQAREEAAEKLRLEQEAKRKAEEARRKQAQAQAMKKAEAAHKKAEAEAEKKAVEAKKNQPKPKPNPEILTKDNAFSTFSLNVSDVSFKLAAASLEKNELPATATVRSEEFINAFDYHDPAPTGADKLAFAWERAGDSFAHNRDLIRFSIQTAALGRESGQPLNIVVLLDNSGSMERADRLRIVRQALRTLANQMTSNDRISIVAFARTPRLWVNGMRGGNPDQLVDRVLNLTPQGGTNLEAALDLAYSVAQTHFLPNGNNRVILLTDGAANLGNVEPEDLKAKAEIHRKRGIALDAFGIGWDGYNDDLLEALTRNADGRYGFLNTPREAAEDFADQLAGSLRVAASNVKAQIEFNPDRVISFRQIGYEKHQLKKEQFRDNTVDAAEIGAAESGTALYSIQINREGTGPIGTVRVRFLNPATGGYEEQEWPLAWKKTVPTLADATPSMRLAGSAAAFAEWLARSPYAGGVTPAALQSLLAGVADEYPNDERPRQLETMIQQARQLSGSAGGP